MTVTVKLDNRVMEKYECYKAKSEYNAEIDTLIVSMESYIDYIDDEQINFDKLNNPDFDIKF